MGLDFRRATDLFMGSEEELARALRIEGRVLREHRRDPSGVPADILLNLADVLGERGRAMIRVGEMVREQATGSDANGAAPN